jgi:hypothetical protein
MLQGFIHKIVVKKDAGQIVGAITYFTPIPSASPPFEIPPSAGKGDNLPIGSCPLGAPLYRQIFTHPIIFQNKIHSP